MARDKKKQTNGSKPESEEQAAKSLDVEQPSEQDAPAEQPESRDATPVKDPLELTEGDLEDASREDLVAHIHALQTQAEEYLDGWQRARAELINFKNRVNRERENARTQIAGDILVQYLGVVDDLERALQDQPMDGDAKAWAEGIAMINLKLKAILDSEGVEPIDGEGQKFDPHYHEAISYEDSEEFEDGEVIDVVQKGYKLGDRILRPAMVRVAK
jgi:molecular chaperone GrpE